MSTTSHGSVSALMVMGLLFSGYVGAQAVSVEGTIEVRVVVDTAYADGLLSQELDELIQFLSPTRATLEPGLTLSHLIGERYRIYEAGPTATPILYATIRDRITELNAIEDSSNLQPGEYLVPMLPKRALTAPNPANPNNDIPIIVTLSSASSPTPKSPKDLSAIPLLISADEDASKRRGSQRTVVTVTMSEADYLSRCLPLVLCASDDLEVSRQILNINLAHATASSENFLNTTELKKIQSLLRREPTRRVLLLVADSCWPDQLAMRQSWSRLNEILLTTAREFQFGEGFGATPTPSFRDPKDSHCRLVAESLAKFESFDLEDAVETIFIPLSIDQEASSLLKDFVEVSELIELVRQSGRSLGEDPPPEPIRRLARERAKRVVENLPEPTGGQRTLVTDKALLEAIVNVFSAYCEETQSFYFLNFSWTVWNNVLKFAWPSQPYSFLVSAAGNEGVDVHLAHRDFAQLSSYRNDVLVIMNTDRQGNLLCNSSTVTKEPGALKTILAASFDGSLASGPCGTSFASPRVAWLLASDLAHTADFEPIFWASSLASRVKELRDGLPPEGQRIWFDPIKFLSDHLTEVHE